jgi:hypothetical protein
VGTWVSTNTELTGSRKHPQMPPHATQCTMLHPILKALLFSSTARCCFGLDTCRSGYLSHSSNTHQVTHYQHLQMKSKCID